MAARELVALRLDPETRERLEWLAGRLGVNKSTLMRRMIDDGIARLWALAGQEDSRGE